MSKSQKKTLDQQLKLTPEDERLIRVIEQNSALPEQVKAILIERIITSVKSNVATDSSTHEATHEARPLLSRILPGSPSALLESVTQRVDNYRTERVEQVRNEWRRLVDRVDLQGEVQRLLSQISIDVMLSIRLVPKEDATFGMAPQVETSAKLRVRSPDDEKSSHSN